MNTSFYGRLTRDPEIKTPQNGGNPYTRITVATQVRNKDKDGKNKSVFVDAVAFGRSGNSLPSISIKDRALSYMAKSTISVPGSAAGMDRRMPLSMSM